MGGTLKRSCSFYGALIECSSTDVWDVAEACRHRRMCFVFVGPSEVGYSYVFSYIGGRQLKAWGQHLCADVQLRRRRTFRGSGVFTGVHSSRIITGKFPFPILSHTLTRR